MYRIFYLFMGDVYSFTTNNDPEQTLASLPPDCTPLRWEMASSTPFTITGVDAIAARVGTAVNSYPIHVLGGTAPFNYSLPSGWTGPGGMNMYGDGHFVGA